MNIYAILSTKPHNPHYLKRYIRFIQDCKIKNININKNVEQHHICPKAKDMFPEYRKFSEHPWNCAVLTARQHFIAHLILWKAFSNIKSIQYALWQMSHTREGLKLNSKTYSILKEQNVANASLTSKKRVKDGTHNFLGGDLNRKRVKDGSHPFLAENFQRDVQRKRLEDGSHNFLAENFQRKSARKRIENGTHHFLGGELQRKSARKRVEEGTHNLIGLSQKKVKDGTHHFLGSVMCVNQNGNIVLINKEVYHNQSGPREKWKYIFHNSKEGKIRKLKNGKSA